MSWHMNLSRKKSCAIKIWTRWGVSGDSTFSLQLLFTLAFAFTILLLNVMFGAWSIYFLLFQKYVRSSISFLKSPTDDLCSSRSQEHPHFYFVWFFQIYFEIFMTNACAKYFSYICLFFMEKCNIFLHFTSS